MTVEPRDKQIAKLAAEIDEAADRAGIPWNMDRKLCSAMSGRAKTTLATDVTRTKHDGRLHGPPFMRVGRSVRYRRDLVARWLAEQQIDDR